MDAVMDLIVFAARAFYSMIGGAIQLGYGLYKYVKKSTKNQPLDPSPSDYLEVFANGS